MVAGILDLGNRLTGDPMIRRPFDIDEETAANFCLRHGIRRLSLFGSVLRPDFRAESDVDVLIEFEPEQTPGFLALSEMQDELTSLIGRKVDLRTPEDLSHYFRDEVLAEAEVRYAKE